VYNWNVILRKTGIRSWTLFSDKGHEITTFPDCSKELALDKATAYISSWNSIGIKVEDETDKKTD
jgi:hypothetical protein